jgi:hypothetical protein
MPRGYEKHLPSNTAIGIGSMQDARYGNSVISDLCLKGRKRMMLNHLIVPCDQRLLFEGSERVNGRINIAISIGARISRAYEFP